MLKNLLKWLKMWNLKRKMIRARKHTKFIRPFSEESKRQIREQLMKFEYFV